MVNEHHPTAWYPNMTRGAKNALWAAFLCYAAAAMSMNMLELVFILDTPLVPRFCTDARHVADNIVSCTLWASAFGGWFFGWLSDRIGRARTLQITIVCIAVSTHLCGWAWAWELDYTPLRLMLKLTPFGDFGGCTPLGLMCSLVGFGFGGAWTAGAVLVGEWASKADRGKTVGAMQSGWVAGWLVALLVQKLLLVGVADKETASRWIFWLGLAPVGLAFFVRRRFVDDAPAFQAVRLADMTVNFFAIPRAMLAGFVDFFTNFLENVPAILTWAMTFVLSIGAMAGYYAITLRLPGFLKSQGHALTDGYFFVFISGSFIGYFVGAWASDRFGRHFAFTTSALGSIIFTIGLCVLPLNDAWVLALTFWLGFFASAVFSGMGAFFTELYPTPTRGARQGSSYSFGRKFAYNLLLIQQFDVHLPSPLLAFVVIAYFLVVLAALWLPETRGRDLTDLTNREPSLF